MQGELIDFYDVRIVTEVKKKSHAHQYRFECTDPGRTILMRAKNEAERMSWVAAIDANAGGTD